MAAAAFGPVAISIDTREDALLMLELMKAAFPILVGADREANPSYGMFDRLGDGVATHATFIVLPDGTVGWLYFGEGITDRPTKLDPSNRDIPAESSQYGVLRPPDWTKSRTFIRRTQ